MNTVLSFLSDLLAASVVATTVRTILAAFAATLVIVWVYQRTHRGISYAQSFVMAMVMLGVLAAMAMMIVSTSIARALGVLGIFALIRFRTILKDTKDVAYLFFVLAVGVAIGTDNYLVGVVGTLMLSAIILILSRYNFGSFVREGFLLTVVTDGDFVQDSFKRVFDDDVLSSRLLQIKALPTGEQEYYFAVRFRNADDGPARLVGRLRSLAGTKIVELITGRDATEY